MGAPGPVLAGAGAAPVGKGTSPTTDPAKPAITRLSTKRTPMRPSMSFCARKLKHVFVLFITVSFKILIIRTYIKMAGWQQGQGRSSRLLILSIC
jgi:hypothetical protein